MTTTAICLTEGVALILLRGSHCYYGWWLGILNVLFGMAGVGFSLYLKKSEKKADEVGTNARKNIALVLCCGQALLILAPLVVFLALRGGRESPKSLPVNTPTTVPKTTRLETKKSPQKQEQTDEKSKETFRPPQGQPTVASDDKRFENKPPETTGDDTDNSSPDDPKTVTLSFGKFEITDTLKETAKKLEKQRKQHEDEDPQTNYGDEFDSE